MNAIRHAALAAALIITPPALNHNAYAESGHKAHWSYEGHEGPENWGNLSHDYEMCKTGKAQSPIDISSISSAALEDIESSYKKTSLDVVNNGHTIQVNYNNGSSIRVDGKTYNLLQFHFHSPSEHHVDGKPADMVAHLVHQANDGQLAVIGVLINKGNNNKTIETIWNNMSASQGNRKSSAMINVADLLPSDLSYYNYSGSLTTPPCSEGVNWMVLQNPIQASAGQIARFNEIFTKSVRPVQPLNKRMVKAN